MKLKLVVFSLFLLGGTIAVFAQDVVKVSGNPSFKDEFDNPLTNIIDPVGRKLGDWFYHDSDDKTCFKQVFEMNYLMQSFVQNPAVESVYWLNCNSFSPKASLNAFQSAIADKLIFLKDLSYNENQLIVVKKQGVLKFHFLGEWTVNQINAIQKLGSTFQTTLDTSDDYYFFFE